MHITDSSPNAQQFQFGGGNWMYESYIEVNTLSDATNRFRFISGFGNIANSGAETHGAFFTYDEGGVSNGTIASPNWQCVTTVASVRTLTTTSVAVTTTWTKLRIIVNADATEVKFYIDGTLVATHTTNIPVLPNRFKVKQMIAKSLGTGNRFVYCDYIFYENNLTTLR
jgi:energy-coupling factor transporter transmembrane protein EcfT